MTLTGKLKMGVKQAILIMEGKVMQGAGVDLRGEGSIFWAKEGEGVE